MEDAKRAPVLTVREEPFPAPPPEYCDPFMEEIFKTRVLTVVTLIRDETYRCPKPATVDVKVVVEINPDLWRPRVVDTRAFVET
jgi:hypothetical protein